MEKTDCRELLEVHRNVIDVESIAFLMILLAPEVSFVTLHMRWHKGCFPKASTKINIFTGVSLRAEAAGKLTRWEDGFASLVNMQLSNVMFSGLLIRTCFIT